MCSEISNPGKVQVFYLEQIWWLAHFITDEKCDLIEGWWAQAKVVKLNIYIKSGHGSVMKKQLFYLYKWRIVRHLMAAYFISWKDEKLRNEIKIKLSQPLARNDQAGSSIIIERFEPQVLFDESLL